MSAARSRMRGTLAALAPPLLYVVLAWPALYENSATYDETDHVPAGYVYVTRGDFRVGYDHPALLREIAALPLLASEVRISPDAERALASSARDLDALWIFGDRVLYRDNAPGPLLLRARLAVLALGAALVALVGACARRAFGAGAGVFAATMAALDPNLLAHGTLATLDVGFTLFYFAAIVAAIAAMRTLTPFRVLAAGALIGATVAAKHSAAVLAPTMLVLGVMRACRSSPWPMGRGTLRTAAARLVALVVLAVVWAVLAWAAVWATYGFRYAAAPGAEIPIADWIEQSRELRVIAEYVTAGTPVPDDATIRRLATARPMSVTEQLIAGATRARILPEAYLASVAVQGALMHLRRSYLAGEIVLTGHRRYFPIAFAAKTPATTLALLAIGAGLLIVARWRDRHFAERTGGKIVLLLLPPLLFLLSATPTSLNLGYRHILPMLPFLYVLLGALPAAAAALVGRRGAAIASVAAAALLASETLAARPYFLPFFNVFAGGARGGLRLLSDSNLDWGQALPALRRWMAASGVARINLCYFGTADPRAYDIDFVPLQGTYALTVPGVGTAGYPARTPELPGWVAISATNLQGTYLEPDSLRDAYAFLLRKEPVAVVGGAIYVYWVDRWGD